MERYASMHRKTNEVKVTLELCLDEREGSAASPPVWAFLTTCSPPSLSTGALA